MKSKMEGYELINILDEYLLIPVGINIINKKGIICINESAAYLWNQIKMGKDSNELAISLSKKYDLDKEISEEHVNIFISNLDKLLV